MKPTKSTYDTMYRTLYASIPGQAEVLADDPNSEKQAVFIQS